MPTPPVYNFIGRIESCTASEFRALPESVKSEKLNRDNQYAAAVQMLAAQAKAGLITKDKYLAQKKAAYDHYTAWALSVGVYKKIDAQIEHDQMLSAILEAVNRLNAIRVDVLGKSAATLVY